MLSVSTELKKWKNAASRPDPRVELYDVEIPDGTVLRLVAGNPTGTGSLTYAGNVYTAAAIARDEEQQTIEGDLPALKVVISNINGVAGGYIERFDMDGQLVTITSVLLGLLDPANAVQTTYTIGNVAYEREAAVFELAQTNLFRRRVPWKAYQRVRCQQGYEGRFLDANGCGFPSDGFEGDTEQDIAISTTGDAETEHLFGWFAINAFKTKRPPLTLAEILQERQGVLPQRVEGFEVNGRVPGSLYIASISSSISWNVTNRQAPFLFKKLSGDFDVFTRAEVLDPRAGMRAGLLCQDAGIGTSWIVIGRSEISEGVLGIRVSSANVGSGVADTTESVADEFLRMKRTGNVFDLYRGTAFGGPWTLASSRTIAGMSTLARLGLSLSAPSNETGPVSASFPYIQFRAGGLPSCSRVLDDSNGCRAHGNTPHFLAFLGMPQRI